VYDALIVSEGQALGAFDQDLKDFGDGLFLVRY